MITVCAGRLTPHASVAVEHSTWTWRSAKRSSTSVRSARARPAWWIAKPYGRRSLSASDLAVSHSSCRISRVAESSRTKRWIASSLSAMSRSAAAVFAVSARECTKMRTWFRPACASTFS